MATSLALQLQKIAAASTSTLDTKKLKTLHSASLLFDRAHAATQGLDTIFSIALNGFNELCALDHRFIAFEKGLFSESSKEVDRFVQTKEEVKELDRSIEAFLELVSGRLLLKPAIKAVEWLVRRFRIQDQNTTAFVLCFLPYHSHPVIFPMMLSIVEAGDLVRELQFLRPYLKPAAAVPRHAITHALSHRRDFLDLLSTHVSSVVKARRDSHPLLSFFAAVITESMSLMCDAARTPTRSGITEETVLQKALPILEDAYRAKKSPEYQVGAYMLTTVIVSKIPVRDEVMLALMTSITEGWSKDTLTPGLATIALIAEARESTQMPPALVQNILAVQDLVPRLQTMGTKYRVDNLILGIASGILGGLGQKHGERELGYVIELLENSSLGSKGRKTVFAGLVEAAQNLHGFEEKPEDEEAVRDILATRLLQWSEQSEDSKLGKTMQLVFEENKVDVEMLELALRTVIRRPQIAAKDAPKAIEAAPVEVLDLNALLDSIPKTPSLVSILGPADSSVSDQLQQAFILASQKASDIAKMSEHAIFAGREPTDALYLSVLGKVWTSNASPILSRASALKQAVKAINANSHAKIDYQGLIPLVLVALADSAERVRREAAALVHSLKSVYETDDAIAGKKKKKADAMQYWGYETMYGSGVETDNLKWLESSDAGKFLDLVLSKSLQECVLDASFIGRVLENGLGSTKKSDKKKDDAKLKSTAKSSVLMFLASHVISAPSVLIKLRLLASLNQISKAPTSRTEFLLPALVAWASGSFEEHQAQCDIERISLGDLETELVTVVAEGEDVESVQNLVNIVDRHLGGQDLASAAAKRIIAIWKSLDAEVKSSLAETILAVRLKSGDDTTGSSEATEVLSNVELPTETFQSLLNKARDQLKTALGLGASGNIKRQRTSATDGVAAEKEEQKSLAVTRITVVLELLESQGAHNHVSVLATMFGVLADVGSVDFAGITYLQSVILSCVRDIIKVHKVSSESKWTDTIRADVLVSCIRSTGSPQVQNSALLLLSSLADIAPDTVKHSVMPIFTFMGANTLRQDDEYSAHVIEQTVRRIIPPLVKSLQAQGGSPVVGAAELVSTFVTSYKHVPTHRRLRLFLTLTETLGPEEFLFAILAKLAGKYNVADASTDIKEFTTQLATEFSAEVQLASVVKYLATVEDVLEPKKGGLAEVLFAADEQVVQSVDMASRLLNVLKTALGSSSLKSNVSKSLKNSEEAEKLRAYFASALEKTMALGEKYVGQKAIATEVAAVMEQLLDLLSVVEFVNVIDSLISQKDSMFRKSALATFKDRVISEYRTDAPSRTAILGLMPKIGGILSSDASNELKADSLLCIQAVTTKFGKQDLNTIFGLTNDVVGLGGLLSEDVGLRVLALVCLTHMATTLGGRIVPVLPKSVPVAIDYIHAAVQTSSPENDLIHNAGFRYLRELVQIVPSFMTSYLPKLLPLTSMSASNEDYEDETPEDVRQEFLDTIAERLEFKTLIGAFTKSWSTTLEHGHLAIEESMETVQKAISHATKTVVQKSHQTLLTFFTHSLDVRRTSNSDESEELEDLAIQVVLDTVFKLNDTLFKPMFLRLIEWAVEDLKDTDSSGRWSRTTTLWRLLESLGTNLKALVTDYYSYVLPNAIDILSTPVADPSDTPHNTAWKSLLSSLRTAFATDERDFWQSPTHFDPLIEPLMAQLDVASLDTTKELVIPAVVELAAAAQSEEHFKTINNAILKRMRAESELVRLGAVVMMKELYARCGEDWLGLLPETVPIIAELMEDDDEEVERETQRLIQKVEEFLGEGELQGMLT